MCWTPTSAVTRDMDMSNGWQTRFAFLLSTLRLKQYMPIGTTPAVKEDRDDDAAERAYLVYQPERKPHNTKRLTFVDASQVDKEGTNFR